jgi:hypothetical protein
MPLRLAAGGSRIAAPCSAESASSAVRILLSARDRCVQVQVLGQPAVRTTSLVTSLVFTPAQKKTRPNDFLTTITQVAKTSICRIFLYLLGIGA